MARDDLGRDAEAAIAAYLERLRREVHGEADADEIVAEAADHLWSAVARQMSRGVPMELAAERAVRSYGPVEDVGVGFRERDLTGGLAVPTRLTRRGGRALQVAAVSLVVAIAALIASEAATGVTGAAWTPTVWTVGTGLLVLSAGAGAVGAQSLLVRHGRERGPLAIAAGTLLMLGALVSVAAWAALVWLALLGLGWGAINRAIGRRTPLSPVVVRFFGFGYLVAFVGTLAGALAGSPDAWPNWQVVGLVPGIATQAVGMWLAGTALAGEIALDRDGVPVAPA